MEDGDRGRRQRAEGAARLLAALRAEVAPLSDSIVERIRTEVPSFAAVPLGEQLADTRLSVETLLAAALDPAAGRPDPDQLIERGRRRAEQGVPVEDLLRAWRLSVELATDHARAVAALLELDPQLVIDVFQGALGAADEAMVALTDGHRAAIGSAPVAAGAEERFIFGAIAGELEGGRLRGRAISLGLDPSCSYHAIRGCDLDSPGTGGRDDGGERDGGAALFTERDGELFGISRLPPRRAPSGLLAVGPPVALERLQRSLAVAERILAAGRALGLAGVHDLQSAGPQVAIFESADVGEALVERLVRPAQQSPQGADLIASVVAWFETGMRVEPAAERLHVHANTLRHRLKRYQELSGADLSSSEDVFSVWWALTRHLATGAVAQPRSVA